MSDALVCSGDVWLESCCLFGLVQGGVELGKTWVCLGVVVVRVVQEKIGGLVGGKLWLVQVNLVLVVQGLLDVCCQIGVGLVRNSLCVGLGLVLGKLCLVGGGDERGQWVGDGRLLRDGRRGIAGSCSDDSSIVQ